MEQRERESQLKARTFFCLAVAERERESDQSPDRQR
jgi:hypothetical protein